LRDFCSNCEAQGAAHIESFIGYWKQRIVKDNRPVNLNLFAFKFPLPAITSILHRISGVILFLGTAALLYLLELSLRSPAGFQQAADLLDAPLIKLVLWAILAGLMYHLIAGIKHLIMDMGVGETKQGGKTGAVITIVLSVVAIAATGVWVW
jgi:succinate dehydrogenase / fumarate reductase cytochrome b subunit